MARRSAVTSLALGIGLVVLLGVVLYMVLSTLLSILWSLLTIGAALLAAAALGYVAVKGALWLYRKRGRSSETGLPGETQSAFEQANWTKPTDPANAADSTDPIDRLTDRYVDGELTEAELERRLERELDESDRDEVDREFEQTGSERV